MAERRMFAKSIIDSDAFLDMPVTARLLYYDLSMRADDDGFVNAPKKIMRVIGASQDDLAILATKKFIIPFDNGIVVIKHWRIHNYIRKDTYNETNYKEEKALLELDENKAYRLNLNVVDEPLTNCGQVVDTGDTRLGNALSDSDEKESTFLEEAKEIIGYLNEKTGGKFRYQTKATRENINARLKEGYTVEDFKTVIDNKCAAWLGDKKMSQFLRPETLFRPSHFESYLNEKPQSNGIDWKI